MNIDDDVFSGRRINPNIQIPISGKVDPEFFQDPEIDVNSLEMIGNGLCQKKMTFVIAV